MIQTSMYAEECWISLEKPILYVGSTTVSEENEKDFKSCKCRFRSLKHSRDNKSVPWEETLSNLPNMRDHAALQTASPGQKALPHLLEVQEIEKCKRKSLVQGPNLATACRIYHKSRRPIVKTSLLLKLKSENESSKNVKLKNKK